MSGKEQPKELAEIGSTHIDGFWSWKEQQVQINSNEKGIKWSNNCER